MSGHRQAAGAVPEPALRNLAHDLRGRLNTILGFAQLLELDGPDESARDAGTRIAHAGRQLLWQLEDVFDLLALGAGALRPDIEQALARDMLRDVLRAVEPVAAERGVGVDAGDLGADGGASLRTDPARLRRVLVRLLEAALDAVPPGGRISVAVAARPEGFEIRAPLPPGPDDHRVTIARRLAGALGALVETADGALTCVVPLAGGDPAP